MPFGGPTVGEAYVKIVADTSSLKGDVEKALLADAAAMENAGKQNMRRYNEGARKELARQKGMGSEIINQLQRDMGRIGASGTLLGDEFASNLQKSIQKRLGDQRDPAFIERMSQVLERDLKDMAERGTLDMEKLGNSAKQLSADLRGPLLDAERQVKREFQETAFRTYDENITHTKEQTRLAAQEARNLARETDNLASAAGRAAGGVENEAQALERHARAAHISTDNTRLLVEAIVILGPALVPLAAGLAAFAAGLGALGGVGALAVFGLLRNIKQSTAIGQQASVAFKPFIDEWKTLGDIAAQGVLPGLSRGIEAATKQFPKLNKEVSQLSLTLGGIVGNYGIAFTNMFVQLYPIFNQVAASLFRGSQGLVAWTSASGGFTKFLNTVQTELPRAEDFLSNLAKALVDIVVAVQPLGSVLFNVINLLLKFIDTIAGLPGGTTLLTIAYAMVEVGIASKYIKVAVNSIKELDIISKVDTFSSKILNLGTSTQTAATQVKAANLEMGASAEQMAATTIAANDEAALSNQALAKSVEESAVEQDAARKGVAAGALGWGLAGGAAVLLTGVVFGLTSAMEQNAKRAQDLAQLTRDYAAALQDSSGVVGKNIDAQIIQQGIRQSALDDVKQLGYSELDYIKAVKGEPGPLTDVANHIETQTGAREKLGEKIRENRKALKDAIAADKEQQQINDVISAQYRKMYPDLQKLTGTQVDQNTAIAAAAKAVDKKIASDREQQAENAILIQQNYQLMGTQDQLSKQYGITTQQVQAYAQTLGITQDQVQKGTVNAQTYSQAVNLIAQAQDNATQTQSTWLDALNAFATSGKTSADTAKLIGATLVAANGDALNYAAQMNASAKATADLGTQVGKTAAKFVNAKTGLIDYTKAGAQPLIQGLQALQTSAEAAAEATYQHEKATKGGAKAAQDAIQVYQTGTVGALKSQQKALGLTDKQVQGLSKSYFDLPSDIKTKLELLGTDPTLTALNQIGELLAKMAGTTWKTVFDANTTPASQSIDKLQSLIDSIQQHKVPGLTANPNEAKLVTEGVQNAIDAIAQHKPPTLTANSAKGREVVGAMQNAIDNIKQGRVPGLTANNAAGKARINELQAIIDAIMQHKIPPVNLDITPAQAAAAEAETLIKNLDGKSADMYVNVITRHLGGPPPGTPGGGAYSQQMAGGIITQDQLVRVGENNRKEAIVPLERPLRLVNPEVRSLAAFAQGVPMNNRPAIHITINSNADPKAIAQQVVNRAAALARI